MPGPIVIPTAGGWSPRLKHVSWPGRGNDPANGYVGPFNTLNKDDWYPQVGLGGGIEFTVPVSGKYYIEGYTTMPGYNVVGWTLGWSGEFWGELWITLFRGAGVLEDSIDHKYVNSTDTGQWFPMTSVATRTLLGGDRIRLSSTGSGTGYGPTNYDAYLKMTQLKS